MKSLLVTTSLIAVTMAATAVHAQSAGGTAGGSTAGAQAPVEGGLEEIIVTAQKRAENSQKAPLAVTSLDAETLTKAHIDGATDLQRIVPNLNAEAGGGAGDPGGGTTLFTIRGLGASATGPQGSAGVAAHFDGVYRQDGISNSEFYDLERIEVSPGPQGTLYGRSAAAGAINIIPAKPTTSAVEAAGSAQYGNYDDLTLQGMLNMPLSDTVAVRAAGQIQKHDGYYSNGYDALKAQSGRLQMLFRPDDQLSIRLAGNYTHLGGVGAGNVFVGGPSLPGLIAAVPQAGNSDPRKASVDEYCVINGLIVNTCRQHVDLKKYSFLADMSYDFGGATLTLLPAYVRSDRDTVFANAPIAISNYNQLPYNNEQVNLEARLGDSGNTPLKWVVGSNYYKNKVNTFVDQFINVLIPAPIALPTPPFPAGTTQRAISASHAFQGQRSQQKSYAAFAQATYPVKDNVRLTLGGRYNHDESSGTQTLGNVSNLIYAQAGTGPLPGGTVLANALPAPITTPPQTGSRKFNAFTYRAAVDVDVGPRSIVYASVGTGYKPGGQNDGGPLSSTTPASPLAPDQFFGPERVTHFEVGSKNRFLANTLQLNGVIYYDKYKNYQNGATQVVNPLQFGALGFVVTNAGQARVYGTELSLKWQPTEYDSFELSGNYLNAKFTSYTAPANLSPNGPVPATVFDGFVLPNAPKFSANVSYRHTFDLGNHGKVEASAFTHISDSYWVYFAEAQGSHQKSYTDTTLDLSWTPESGKFTLGAFVKNLENHDVKVFGGSSAGYTQVTLAAPRTYGGTASFKF